MPVAAAAATHYVDWVVFVVAAVVMLAGGLGVVSARHPVHSALFLIQTLFGVAILFVEEAAQFLAAVQVIVYAGAIVVLFLFVIMLIGVGRPQGGVLDVLKAQRPVAVLIGVIGLAEFAGLLNASVWATGTKSGAGQVSGAGSNVEKLGRSLFTTYLMAFEVTSALLVIAVVASVVLVRRPHAAADDEEARADAELERAG
jgi:NADH-quinone oxidoreductase subunit J